MGLVHSRGLPSVHNSLHSLYKGQYFGNVWKSKGQITSLHLQLPLSSRLLSVDSGDQNVCCLLCKLFIRYELLDTEMSV